MVARLKALAGVVMVGGLVVGGLVAGGPAEARGGSTASPGTVTVGDSPYGVALSPDGTRAYVPNFGSSSVSVIDTSTNTVSDTVTVGSNPASVAVSADGAKAYVAIASSDVVSVIDTSTDAVVNTITVGNSPYGVVLSPDGTRVYVANYNGRSVSVIDTSTDTVTDTIPMPSRPDEMQVPYGLAVTPDGSRVYVTLPMIGMVAVIDTSDDSVDSITIGAYTYPYQVTVAPDGAHAYVGNQVAGSVSVIDTSTDTVTDTIDGIDGAYGVAVSPDSTHLYVAGSGAPALVVVDTSTDTISDTRPLTVPPYALTISSDGALLYAADRNDGLVSVVSTADHPAAPTDVSAVAGDGTASVSFTAPDDDGGAPVDSYTVTSSPGGVTATCSSSPCTVAGLTNGTAYTFTVHATNVAGSSAESSASDPVTPTAPVVTPPNTPPTTTTAPTSGSGGSWFQDPLSKKQRHQLVPAKPGRAQGPLRATKASYRTHDGTIAVPDRKAHGHQLAAHEGVQLTDLFAFDSTRLTAAGHHRLVKLARSLKHVHALVCEGYADYGGNAGHEQRLSTRRAAAVCRVLTHRRPHLHVRVVGYGSRFPVVVGGTAQTRTDNRRVDLRVKR